MSQVLIGTSGWSYESWRGPFFPERGCRSSISWNTMPSAIRDRRTQRRVLPHADARGRARLARQTADDFVFAWKASKFITHWKRLSENSRQQSCADGRRDCRCSATRPGRFCFSCRRNFEADARPTCRRSSSCCSKQAPLRFRISSPELVRADDPAICCAKTTSRFVCPTITTRRRRGGDGRLRLCARTWARRAISRVTIAATTLAEWAARIRPGRGRAATSSSISTTTRKAPRPSMRCV